MKTDESRIAWISRVLDFIVRRGRKMMHRFIKFLLEVGQNYMQSDKGASEMNHLGRYVLKTLHEKRREVRERTQANVLDNKLNQCHTGAYFWYPLNTYAPMRTSVPIPFF